MKEEINILIVDDKPENLIALESIIDAPSYTLIKATSGRAALREILSTDFALILLDVQMPEIDGYEIAQLIRERDATKTTPIIFLTAINYNEENVLKAYEKGAVDILFKPINPVILKSKVNVFVELYKARSIEKSRNKLNKANEALWLKTEQLEESNRELEQFAYIASHDLQEPLRMVASYTQLLAKRYKDQLDTDANEFIDYAVDGVTRMQLLINDLLDFSRITSRKKPFATVHLNNVFEQVTDNLHERIKETNTVVINDGLPAINGDANQLMRLLQNLIDNAIKFNYSENRSIRVKSSVKDDQVLISVQDNGIGIDKKYEDRVFVIFQRLHTRADYPGTGIGLAICKKIVERHGGKIWFESSKGSGTTFYFTLNTKPDAKN